MFSSVVKTVKHVKKVSRGIMSLEEVCVKKENDCVGLLLMDFKQEPEEPHLEDFVSSAEHELYADHQVKGELVLGPEVIQRPDKAYAVQTLLDPSQIKTENEINLESECIKKQPKIRDCFIRLERLGNKIKLAKYNDESNIARHKQSHEEEDGKSRKINRKNTTGINKKIYICNCCDKEYSVKRFFIQHLRKHSRPYECDVCKLTFVHETGLRRHTLVHIVEKQSKTCNNCSEEFATRSALIHHIRKHLGETTCQICNKKLVNTYTLERHKLTHTGDIKYMCDMCGQCYRYKSSLVSHIQKHMGKIRDKSISKPYLCKVCNKRFAYKSLLLGHERSHTGEKPFQCDICGRNFSATNNLRKHKLTHAAYIKERRFSCDLCKKRYIRKDNLTKHKLMHTNEKPFECEICEKRFRYKENLVQHLKLHSSQGIQKPHNCEVCGDKFRIKSHLSIHMLIHTGQKPFSCEVCGDKFRIKSHLTIHMLIHTGQKPFSCEVCGKCFRHKSTLTSHMLLHTGEKPYACDMCAQRFTTSGNYSKHRQTVHK